jgi:hypothetical protein
LQAEYDHAYSTGGSSKSPEKPSKATNAYLPFLYPSFTTQKARAVQELPPRPQEQPAARTGKARRCSSQNKTPATIRSPSKRYISPAADGILATIFGIALEKSKQQSEHEQQRINKMAKGLSQKGSTPKCSNPSCPGHTAHYPAEQRASLRGQRQEGDSLKVKVHMDPEGNFHVTVGDPGSGEVRELA